MNRSEFFFHLLFSVEKKLSQKNFSIQLSEFFLFFLKLFMTRRLMRANIAEQNRWCLEKYISMSVILIGKPELAVSNPAASSIFTYFSVVVNTFSFLINKKRKVFWQNSYFLISGLYFSRKRSIFCHNWNKLVFSISLKKIGKKFHFPKNRKKVSEYAKKIIWRCKYFIFSSFEYQFFLLYPSFSGVTIIYFEATSTETCRSAIHRLGENQKTKLELNFLCVAYLPSPKTHDSVLSSGSISEASHLYKSTPSKKTVGSMPCVTITIYRSFRKVTSLMKCLHSWGLLLSNHYFDCLHWGLTWKTQTCTRGFD